MKPIMLGTISVKDLHGPWTDFMEKLQTEDAAVWFSAFKRFLRKENPWPEQPQKEQLFDFVRTIPLLGSRIAVFSTAQHFAVSSAAGAPVKISGIHPAFKKHFLQGAHGKIEDPTAAHKLMVNRLRGYTNMPTILNGLGGEDRVEVALSTVYRLMEQQRDGGGGGILLVNGKLNIFFAKDCFGNLRAISVNWYRDGWQVQTPSLNDINSEFGEGTQVLTPAD